MIVEDDAFLRKACRDALERDGYGVSTATDGEEALHQVLAARPDVIVLDWLLPKLPGVAVLRTLKADVRCRDIPVLVLSNSTRDEDRAVALDLGAAGYLVKADLNLTFLRRRIKELLGTS